MDSCSGPYDVETKQIIQNIYNIVDLGSIVWEQSKWHTICAISKKQIKHKFILIIYIN